MNTKHDKTSPISRSSLRQFGLLFSLIFVVLFGWLIPTIVAKPLPSWPWYVGAVISSFALILPKTLIIVYIPWMKFGAVAGWINTRLILGLIFYVFITPTGLVIRLFGGDLLSRKFDAKATSYRVKREPPSKDHMENPY